jgi:hypothetical protein
MVDLSTSIILVVALAPDVFPYSQRTVEFYDTRVRSPLHSSERHGYILACNLLSSRVWVAL